MRHVPQCVSDSIYFQDSRAQELGKHVPCHLVAKYCGRPYRLKGLPSSNLVKHGLAATGHKLNLWQTASMALEVGLDH